MPYVKNPVKIKFNKKNPQNRLLEKVSKIRTSPVSLHNTTEDDEEIIYSDGVLKPFNKILESNIQLTEEIGKFNDLQINDKILLAEKLSCKNTILCLCVQCDGQ
uniref:Uncharacterized protein n=1 Tax=Strongyloides venezuelensis TaxID=75913 RepID=A0A0K0FZZ8_STRVS